MTDRWENPIDLDGIDFVEFSAKTPEKLTEIFVTFGFEKIAKHKNNLQKNVEENRKEVKLLILLKKIRLLIQLQRI